MQPQPAGKPRGRPPGSKNKPKPAMNRHQPMLLTVPAGMDIVNAIIDATHNQDVTVMVYHAMGSISEATICNPLDRSRDFFFQGNLFMRSFSGFYSKSFSPSHTPYSFFTAQVSRAGTPNIFGGRVRGKLIAAKPLQIMVFFIKKIEYYKAMTPFIDPNVTKPYYNNPTN
uniref:PPC domain-containing protein n=2 Tax=Cajanus cajan TaxID=3821 RepID=A0A151U1W3_CAJCA|nr:hypothetical protein KK1_005929 [Cajanus cajan]